MSESEHLLELYPHSGSKPLPGLYLGQDLRNILDASPEPLVYTNFVTSLDGRIALVDRDSGISEVPEETANPRDWRLLQELAAPADAIVMSGRYLRDLASGNAQALPPFSGELPEDIGAYRKQLGLDDKPALVFVSGSLDLPEKALDRLADRKIMVATGKHPPDKLAFLKDRGIGVLSSATQQVSGGWLVKALSGEGLRLIYSIAGPGIMHTLVSAGVLWRIYLTTVTRVLGGEAFATLTRGAKLQPVRDFELTALYLDRYAPDTAQQLLQVYTRKA
ncbi:MAG: dihydrofolate reductase family protein [Candidatus Thiodiazotropha sp.]